MDDYKNLQMHFLTLKFNNPKIESEFRKYHHTKIIIYQRFYLWVLLIVSIIWLILSKYLGLEAIYEKILFDLKKTLVCLICLSLITIILSYVSFFITNYFQPLAFLVCFIIGSILLNFFNNLPYTELITYSYGIVILFIFAFLTLSSMNVILSTLISFLLITSYALILYGKMDSLNIKALIPILYIPTAFIFAIVGAYAFEKMSRREFVSTNVIKKNEAMLQGLSSKLSKYLSPNLYESIFTGQKEVQIETVRKKLTVFFSDIQGFTELTDSIESETLTLLLNSYMNEMAKIALKYEGTIDKFIGDAIMIFFGDPKSKGEDEDAIQCVLMAIEMQDKIKRLREEWRKMGSGKDIQVRMGIHSGFCTVGNFGSENRLDYTIIGGNVNLAKRLETAAQEDQILISDNTFELVKDKIYCRKKEKIYVKGIAYPVQTYQVLGCIGEVDKDEIEMKFSGFSLSINYDEVDKQRAIDTLNKALKRFGIGSAILNRLKFDFFSQNSEK